MPFTAAEVVNFIEENDVKFIRLAFCDVFGNQKNISIMPYELTRAFEDGISFDAAAIAGFGDEYKSDLVLVPDSSTITLLPWRPAQGRVARMFCAIRLPDGTPFELDCRRILQSVTESMKDEGIDCVIGAECEFYLFESDERGNLSYEPLDHAGYMDVAPDDKGENVRREICLTLEEMGIVPESSHHEEGPGQNEIDFQHSDPLKAADDLTTFKFVVRNVAALHGLHAVLAPKPLLSSCGNGLHINLSPVKDGEFDLQVANSFMAGIMERICEITAFLNPTVDSYKRLGSFKAPKYVAWSPENRSQLIRIPGGVNDRRFRMELRSPDPMTNPYLAYALILSAGFNGIKRGLVPPQPQNMNLFTASQETLSKLSRLPESFKEAVKIARNSNFVKSLIPEAVIETYAEREDM